MNAYCTIDQVAADLNIAVTVANTEKLTRCAEAAAKEIDHAIDSITAPVYTQPWEPLYTAVNVSRAVQWFKASDAAVTGVAGYDQTGQLKAPATSFAAWAAMLIPHKDQWGIA